MKERNWKDSLDDWWVLEVLEKYPRLKDFYYPIKRNISKYYWNIREFPRRFYERRTRGFDYRDMWDLEWPIAKFIAPRLREFRKNYAEHGTPMFCFDKDPNSNSGLDDSNTGSERASKKWLEIIDKMLYSWECLATNGDWDLPLDDLESEEIKTGNPKFEDWKKANDEHMKKMQEGLDLFSKYLGGLWS